MLTTDLLSRSIGDLSPADFARDCSSSLLHALQPAPALLFDGGNANAAAAQANLPVAHSGGANAMSIDRFEGRYLLSGGADGRVSLWDLDAASRSEKGQLRRYPAATVDKSSGGHKFGITGLSFYPFDSLAFLSSSYDHTLKLFDSVTMSSTASFPLPSAIYAHAVSPIASHLLVACGTTHPAVRLADLKTGTATHALVGHSSGPILALAWSPQREHILATGGSDGTVRIWDIRRAAGSLGVFDMEDAIGIAGHDGLGTIARRRDRGRAHLGPVNALIWTPDGRHVISAGHDERLRVWDVANGANTLANFGPSIRNNHLSSLPLALAPDQFVKPNEGVIFYPNEKELLMFETFEGRLIKRLRPIGVSLTASATTSKINARNRILSMAWRPHNIELLSGHSDGVIRAWLPRTRADAMAEESEESSSDDEGRDDKGRGQKRHKPNVFNAM